MTANPRFWHPENMNSGLHPGLGGISAFARRCRQIGGFLAACWHAVMRRVSPVIQARIARHAEQVRADWARYSVTTDDVRGAVNWALKGVSAIGGLLGFQFLLYLFLDTSSDSFKTYDWLALLIKGFITGIGISLYKPIALLVAAPVAAFVQSDERPGWHSCCGNFVAVARNLTLFACFGILCLFLLPTLATFNDQVLHARWLTSILWVCVALAVIGILVTIWVNTLPIIDLLSDKITDTLVPVPPPPPSLRAVRVCPQCQAPSGNDSRFCADCGTSLQQATDEVIGMG